MIYPNSIWDNLEMSCISRDLSYEDYLHFHKALQMQSSPLVKEAYEKLDELFHISMEADINSYPK